MKPSCEAKAHRHVGLDEKTRLSNSLGVSNLAVREDETSIANVIVMSDLYDRNRLVVTRSKLLLVEGRLQNQDNVINVKAVRLTELSGSVLELQSHDFH